MNILRTLRRGRDRKRTHLSSLVFVLLASTIGACTPSAPPSPTPAIPTVLAPSATARVELPTPAPNSSPTTAPSLTPPATLLSSPAPTRPATLALTPTRQASTQRIELLSRMGGTFGAAVAVADNYVYLSIGSRFVVLDIVNPGEPKQIGQGSLLPSYITSIAIRNGYAFVITQSAGVSVFNLSNIRQPVLAGTLTNVKAQQLAFDGDYAFAVDEAGFKVYRLTDPTHWVPVSSIAYDGATKRLAVSGKYAYVTGTGLHIVDVSDPAKARDVGTYTGMDNSTDVAIIGNYAWVITGYLWRTRAPTGELHVVDITNPAKPTRVNVIPFNQPTQRLIIANGFAYVAAYWDLHVLSTDQPSSPREVSTYRATGQIADLAALGTRLMIASSDADALRIVSIARPERLGDLGSFYTPKSSNRIVVADRYAYIADLHYGFLVMDLADPSAPVIVGEATEFFEGWDIALAGNYLYLSSGNSLRIFRLLNPTYAVPVGALPLPLNGRTRVTIAGTRAYVTGAKVFVVDISQPDAPKLMSTLAFPDDQASDLAITGHYAVIADAEALRIVDTADSTRLKEVGSLRVTGWPLNVRVAGDYAYVVTNQTGLHVINIADVTKPVEASFIPANNITDVAVAGTLAWVSDDNVGLHALDVTNPAKPVDVDAYRTKLASRSATIVGDYAYVAESTGGIAIFRIRP